LINNYWKAKKTAEEENRRSSMQRGGKPREGSNVLIAGNVKPETGQGSWKPLFKSSRPVFRWKG